MKFLIITFLWFTPVSAQMEFFIATDGSDANSGSNEKPFASLVRAREAIRGLKLKGEYPEKGVTVFLRGGHYFLDKTFALEQKDSGTETGGILYCSYPNETVRVSGAQPIKEWKPVEGDILERLSPDAKKNVMQADLKALGIKDFGELKPRGMGRPGYPAALELFYKDRPMTLARYPNQGWEKVAATPAGKDGGKFGYSGDRPGGWAGQDVWVHGYWTWDWADSYESVKHIDTVGKLIETHPPHGKYGYKKGSRFYYLNVLEELDSSGEWYLDRSSGILYFWPPAQIGQNDAYVSLTEGLVDMASASNIQLRGITFEGCRGTAVVIQGGENIRVSRSVFRNIGNKAVSVSAGRNHGIVGCDISETGDGGIVLSGGDRNTLTSAGHYAENNHIHHFSRWCRTYRPGVMVIGVGNRVSHNLIHHSPHNGLQLGGNEHLIEFNELHNLCEETGDVGAFYMGRDWTARGTVIRHNFFHHIFGPYTHGAMSVYLDDAASGITIYGNVFLKASRAAFIGGGRDNTVENNVFIDCHPSVHIDARGLTWAKDHIREGGGWQMYKKLESVNHNQPPYREKYPKLATILDRDPRVPAGNTVVRNISFGGSWLNLSQVKEEWVHFEDNLVTETDPGFMDLARLNLQLKEDSPAFEHGFKKIPFENIGIYKDELRASWPVEHPYDEVRTAEKTRPAPKFQKGPPPVYEVPLKDGAIKIDGTFHPEEWSVKGKKPLLLEYSYQGQKTSPTSDVWIIRDQDALYVAFKNRVADKPLKKEPKWGMNDAVEIAFRKTAGAPTIVLRGFVSGAFESSDEAGAAPDVAKKAASNVDYAAQQISPREWHAEWRIPFASIDVDPSKDKRLEFNLTVHQSDQSVWLMWVPTNGNSWLVERAGRVEFRD